MVLGLGLTTGCDAFDFGRLNRASGAAASASGSAGLAPSSQPPPVASRADRLVVVAGGDVALGGAVRSWIGADPKYDPLAGVRAVIEDDAFEIVSLVAPLTARAAPVGKGGFAPGPPAGAAALARARVSLVAVTDPHLWASGRLAFEDTIHELAGAGVAHAGASVGPGEVSALTERQVLGWSVAVLTVGEWPAGSSPEGKGHVALAEKASLVERIRAVRARHDLVLVSHGGGTDQGDAPAPATVDLARAAMEAGADAFVGHRGATPLGVGWVSGRPIFYGLGNLVMDEDPKVPWTGRGLLARIVFGKRGEREVSVCPVILGDGEPKLLTGSNRPTQEGIFARAISRLSEPLGGVDVSDPDAHSCMRLTPPRQPVTDSSAPR